MVAWCGLPSSHHHHCQSGEHVPCFLGRECKWRGNFCVGNLQLREPRTMAVHSLRLQIAALSELNLES